ncbi:MAG TPA: sigma-70 family RNA polymerase sigma factor [Candidatus Saccharimonadales bacterium]|nr:sigma-70 family RNA polymerase sigma factor [Candidatus Saccharimonadales bacterium]
MSDHEGFEGVAPVPIEAAGEACEQPAEWAELARSLGVPEDTKIHPETYALAEQLARFEAGRLRGYVRSRVSNHSVQDPEDVTQIALLGLMESFREVPPVFSEGVSPMTLMYGILKHKVADVHRAAQRSRILPGDGVEQLKDTPAEDSVEETVIEAAEREALIAALDNLNDKQKTIVLLAGEGAKIAEIAGAIGSSSPGAVRVAKHRALAAAQRILRSLAADGKAPPSVTERHPLLKRQVTAPKIQKIGMDKIQHRIVSDLLDRYAGGDRYVNLVADEYLAPWYVAGQALGRLLDDSRMLAPDYRALVVYPGQRIPPEFVSYISDATRRQAHQLDPRHAAHAVVVATPHDAIGAATRFEYVALPNTALASLQLRLRRDASFLIRLAAEADPTAPLSGDQYIAPTYAQASDSVAQQLGWKPQDSVRYLRELWFRSGHFKPAGSAKRMADIGAGPHLPRLIKGFDSYDDLMKKAYLEF